MRRRRSSRPSGESSRRVSGGERVDRGPGVQERHPLRNLDQVPRDIGDDAEGVALGEGLAAHQDDAGRGAVRPDARDGLAAQARLAHAGRPQHRDDDGRRVLHRPLEGAQHLPELPLAPGERGAADHLAPALHRLADDGRTVAANHELVAPSRELGRRGVDEHLAALRVAREGGGPVDDLAGGARPVDARASGRDPDAGASLRERASPDRWRAWPRRRAPWSRRGGRRWRRRRARSPRPRAPAGAPRARRAWGPSAPASRGSRSPGACPPRAPAACRSGRPVHDDAAAAARRRGWRGAAVRCSPAPRARSRAAGAPPRRRRSDAPPGPSRAGWP